MSNIQKNDDELNDADFATLFSANKSQPSKELDKLILDNAIASQHDALPQQRETATQKYAPLFGIAAALAFAITLTPLVMNSSGSAPELASLPAPPTKNTSTSMATSGQTAANEQAAVASSDESTQASRIAMTEPASQTINAETPSEETASAETANTETLSAGTTSPETNNTENDSPVNSIASTSAATPVTDTKLAEADIKDVAIDAAVTDAASGLQNSTPAQESVAAVPETEDDSDAIGVESEQDSERLLRKAESDAVAQANKAIEKSLYESESLLESNAPQSFAESSAEPIENSALQNDAEELQEEASVPIAELALNPLSPDSLVANETVALKRSPEPEATLSVGKNETTLLNQQALTNTKTHPEIYPKIYRSSALSWALEIKRLYEEPNIDKAQEELVLFRKKYPNNENERLLPEKLVIIKKD